MYSGQGEGANPCTLLFNEMRLKLYFRKKETDTNRDIHMTTLLTLGQGRDVLVL